MTQTAFGKTYYGSPFRVKGNKAEPAGAANTQ